MPHRPASAWLLFRFLMKRAAVVLLLIISGGGVNAQPVPAGRPRATEYIIDTWQTSEGLPHNSLHAVQQGRDGYLWVASAGGLARFDGVRFKVSHAGDDGLPNNRILALFEDAAGGRWLGTGAGAARWTGRGWEAIPLSYEGVPGEVRAIAETSEGSLWFGSNIGLHRQRAGRLELIRTPGGSFEAVRSLLPQPGAPLLVLTVSNVYELHPGGLRELPALAPLTAGRQLWALGRDQKGALWVCGDHVLLRHETNRWVAMDANEPLLAGNHVAFLAAHNGDIWVASRNQGVHRWRHGRWARISTEDGLGHDDVRALAEDAQGNIWVASNGGGLSRLKPRPFDVFSRAHGLGRYLTSALTEGAAGAVWIGTDGGGVWRYQDERVESFAAEPGFRRDTFVWSLCATRDGSLWLGTFNQGLFRHQDGRVRHYSQEEGLASAWLTALYEDRAGGLWIGSHPGSVQRLAGESFEEIRSVGNVRHAAISAITQTRDGAVWIGTGGEGLMRWADGQLKFFRVADGLVGDTVAALHEDADGVLWIGCSGGLNWFADGRFGRLTAAAGLPDDAILQIQSAPDGNLWLGSNRGLISASRASLMEFRAGRSAKIAAVLYEKADGLPATQFSSEHAPLSLRAQDGALWFSLVNGVVRVDPARVAAATAAPCVVIEQILANGEAVLSAPVRSDTTGHEPGAAPVALRPGQNDLEFHFTALDLASPEKLRFRHRLEGLEDDWQEAGADRVAKYHRLPPGTYHFRVIARSTDGVWGEPGVAVAIRLLPQFWQTLWFRLGLALIALGGVGWLALRIERRRMRVRLQRLEQERRVYQERMRIAQDLHDDLGTSLTEISFLGALARPDTADPQDVRTRLADIVQRAGRLTKALDEIVWAVNPANDTLASTVHYLCVRVPEILRAAAVRCRLDVAETFPEVTLNSEVRHNLLLAVNEAVNNAMKHAGASEIRLLIHVRNGHLEVCVVDNGAGFDPAKVSGERNGLENMRRRLVGVGGCFDLQSAPGKGTTVRLVLPLKPAPAAAY